MQTITESEMTLLLNGQPVAVDIYQDGVALDVEVISAAYASTASGSALTIGNACSSTMAISVDGDHTDLIGQTITVKWHLIDAEDGIEYIPDSDSADDEETEYGSYNLLTGTVMTADLTAGATLLTVADAFYTAGGTAYTPSSTAMASCAASVPWAEIAAQLGITANTEGLTGITLPNGVAPMMVRGGTLQESAGWIASLAGGSAIISRDNVLTVASPTIIIGIDPVTAYAAEGTVTTDEYFVQGINLIETTDAKTSHKYPASASSYLDVSNPLASDALAQTAYNAIRGASWRGGTFRIPYAMLFEPMDIIYVGTEDFPDGTGGDDHEIVDDDAEPTEAEDESIPVIVGNIQIVLTGGCSGTIVSAVQQSADSAGTTGVVTKTINRIEADLIVTKRLIADYIESPHIVVKNEDEATIFEADASEHKLIINANQFSLDEDGNATFGGTMSAENISIKSERDDGGGWVQIISDQYQAGTGAPMHFAEMFVQYRNDDGALVTFGINPDDGVIINSHRFSITTYDQLTGVTRESVVIDYDGIYLNDDTYVDGAVSATSVKVGNHTSAIGSVVTGSASTPVSCATAGTDYEVASVTLPAGTWVITGSARFDNKSDTKYRAITINTSTSSGTPHPNVSAECPAVNGTYTILSRDRIVTPTAETTYYLYARSGTASTNVSAADIRAVRIA